MKYRNKPVVIEAVRFNGTNFKEVEEFCPIVKLDNGLVIPTLEDDMSVNMDDFIIKDVKGEFYPCKPDVFEMTYELIN